MEQTVQHISIGQVSYSLLLRKVYHQLMILAHKAWKDEYNHLQQDELHWQLNLQHFLIYSLLLLLCAIATPFRYHLSHGHKQESILFRELINKLY